MAERLFYKNLNQSLIAYANHIVIKYASGVICPFNQLQLSCFNFVQDHIHELVHAHAALVAVFTASYAYAACFQLFIAHNKIFSFLVSISTRILFSLNLFCISDT